SARVARTRCSPAASPSSIRPWPSCSPRAARRVRDEAKVPASSSSSRSTRRKRAAPACSARSRESRGAPSGRGRTGWVAAPPRARSRRRWTRLGRPRARWAGSGSPQAAARAHAPVLVVDDGSEDGGAAAARAAGADLLHHPRRLGKGQAIRTGIAAARSRGASVVVTLDGDGQHDPQDLPAVLGTAQSAPRAIVIGSRLAEPGALAPDRLNAIRVAGFFVYRSEEHTSELQSRGH